MYHSALRGRVDNCCDGGGSFSSPDDLPWGHQSHREQEFRGPLGVAGLFALLVCHLTATDSGLPPRGRLGNLLTNGGSCLSENV